MALAGGSLAAAQTGGWWVAALWLVASGLGAALYHASFGFTAGYRALLRERRTAQVRAQLLLLGLAIVLFHPAIAAGSVLGQPVRGFVFPIGLALLLGAFLFGIGMQLAGGCASGTLYAVGGGAARPLLTLASFIAGATIAAYGYEHWAALPRLDAISLPATLGFWPALVLQLGALALLWRTLATIERRAHGGLAPLFDQAGASFWRGPWPFGWGAIALAALAFATLVLAGRPWAITQAFALWGSWAVDGAGLDDPHFWPFWEEPTRVALLHRPFWAETISVMDLGIAVGALLAAGIAGDFALRWRMGAGEAASSIIGGLLLGIGAIIATGCNIGAFLAGVASGSLHGWVWILAALPGNALGVLLRPLFRLDPASPSRPVLSAPEARC